MELQLQIVKTDLPENTAILKDYLHQLELVQQDTTERLNQSFKLQRLLIPTITIMAHAQLDIIALQELVNQ